MYHDPWGNKIPYLSVSDEKTATHLMKDEELAITKVVEVPRNKSSIILM